MSNEIARQSKGKEVSVRKLISIGLVIALLVTFLVPVAVGAAPYEPSEFCEDCAPEGPCPVETPDCTTETIGGALLWSLLGTTFIMGRAIGDTTEHLAGTLGCWVDELAGPTFGVMGAILDGLGGLLAGLGDMIGMSGLLGPIGDMLEAIAGVIQDFLP
jgi:hypothetical protein